MVEFDAAKNAANLRKRGVGLVRFMDMEMETAITVEDLREDYGERRFRVWGYLDGHLHTAVVTPRGERTRVISLRLATRREKRAYAKACEQSSGWNEP
jgi:uncharacterized DUF497 family protein